MQIIDGKQLSKDIKGEIAEKVQQIKSNGGRAPHLAAVLVGEDPASQVYVRNKVRSCEQVGFDSTLIRKGAETTEEELLQIVEDLNNNDAIDGFIVQLPLPAHIDEDRVTLAISPDKDVDGFHPTNFGKMMQGLDTFLPATPYGIIEMLDRYNIPTSGKEVVVIGRSNIVGLPMSVLLARKGEPGNCTVTLCHSRTQDLKAHTQKADIIVAAIGRPNFVTGDMIKEGATIIDVGINRIEDATRKSGSRLVGDVDFDSVAEKVGHITPVPGGVGPMTVVSLIQNTLKAYQQNH